MTRYSQTEVQQLLTQVHKITKRNNVTELTFESFSKSLKFGGECQTFTERISNVLHCGELTQMSFTAELQLNKQQTSQHVASYTNMIVT